MKAKFVLKGGPGSGHAGHAGRPGKRGGSAPGKGGGSGSVTGDSGSEESMKISLFKKKYPNAYRALHAMALDNEMKFSNTMVVVSDIKSGLAALENVAGKMSDFDIEDFVAGEYEDMLELAASYGSDGEAANKFLNEVFDGPYYDYFFVRGG